MLSAMRPHCEELVFVSNVKLRSECREKVAEITDEIIQRENKGFDVWAYKTTMERFGWEKLSGYDEVIMMNHTIMGPVYPLDEMFREMDGRKELDFWGITLYHGSPYNPYKKCKYNYIPLHIQSHFIAVRKSLLTSPLFQNYWKNMPAINSYEEAICRHEAIFTKTFEDFGFRWGVYADTRDILQHDRCPILYSPVMTLKEKRCPVFKRRSFFHEYDDLCGCSAGDQGRQLLDFLEKEKLFDAGMIWENILRTCNMADIMRCLCLNMTLPEDFCAVQPEPVKTALIMHLYYDEQYPLFYRYALSMPKNADLYITTSSGEQRERLQKVFSKGPWDHVEVRLVENRGRDVSALLVGCADVVKNYELVCFVHDKRSHGDDHAIMGETFLAHCCDNVLASPEYVGNVLRLFRENKRMGMLFAPAPCTAGYAHTISTEWAANVPHTQELVQRLGLTVPVDFGKEPIAPLGTMFWFRPEALRLLFDMGWKYTDFPEEPIQPDGTLLHATERIYPFAAQQAGYYPMWCQTERNARRYTVNLYSLLRSERVKYPHTPVRIRVKNAVKAIIPKGLWKVFKRVYHAMGGKKWVG